MIARPRRPTKHWKYNPGDVDERASGPRTWRPTARCSSAAIPSAPPWYVIPSDRGIEIAVAQLLVEQLRARPALACANFDVDKRRLGSPRAECSSRYALTTDRWRSGGPLVPGVADLMKIDQIHGGDHVADQATSAISGSPPIGADTATAPASRASSACRV